jgi:hypothetical protein
MTIPLTDPQGSLGDVLRRAIDTVGGASVTLRALIVLIGEQGLLLLCALLCVPFMIPVSIPGVSTVFGLAIILIAIGITTNRAPWLPARLMDKQIDGDTLKSVLTRGLAVVDKVEGFIRPRFGALTRGAAMNRLNGLVVIFAGTLLMLPLGLVPFSNTLPAFGILLLCVGMAQRDGLFVIGGYLMTAATVVYFAVLFWLAVMAGRGAAEFFVS